jgi:hypothetical protein
MRELSKCSVAQKGILPLHPDGVNPFVHTGHHFLTPYSLWLVYTPVPPGLTLTVLQMKLFLSVNVTFIFKKNRGHMFHHKPINVELTNCKNSFVFHNKMEMNPLKPNNSSFPKTA